MSKYIEVYQDIKKKKLKMGNSKRGKGLSVKPNSQNNILILKIRFENLFLYLEMNVFKNKGKNSKVLGHGRMKNAFLGSIQTSQELNQSQILYQKPYYFLGKNSGKHKADGNFFH